MIGFIFESEIWKWKGEKASWYFITLPNDISYKIKSQYKSNLSFGSIRIIAKIGQIQWKTSIFPSKQYGGYILPVKADVRRRCNISEGSFCNVYIELEPKFL